MPAPIPIPISTSQFASSSSSSSSKKTTLLSLLLLSLSFSQPATAQTTTITPAAAQPSQSPQWIENGQFEEAILNSTNFYRSEHNATALTWNSSLADFGANWVQACNFAHSGGPDGENLAEGYQTVTEAVDAWGNEREEYDFSNPGFSEQTGHFTQLVWKSTTTVGCGRKYCTSGSNGLTGWYLTCEYWPRGNVIGEFASEVQAQVNSTPYVGPGVSSSGGGLVSSASGTVSAASPTDTCIQGSVCNVAATKDVPVLVAAAVGVVVVLLVGLGGSGI